MKDITVIIPVHEYNDVVKNLLANAIKSVPSDTKVLISANVSAVDGIKADFKEENIETISNGSTIFCQLVNDAVEKIDTKWFTILEFDDTYTKIWFDEVEKYINYKPNVSVFMPLEEIHDFNDDTFIGYGNESVWASSFSSEIGYIDNECLQNFFDFYLTGSVFNTDDWKSNGGLKPSIKLTFWYEFLLRMTHNGKKVYVIPRVGYKHMLNRENSLIKIYTETIDSKESEGWINIAKQEYFFKKDRNKKYEPISEDED